VLIVGTALRSVGGFPERGPQASLPSREVFS
jgi:hypothetical protein